MSEEQVRKEIETPEVLKAFDYAGSNLYLLKYVEHTLQKMASTKDTLNIYRYSSALSS